MIEIKNGNLFDAKEGLICHQVNCKGNMGRGVAKQFRKAYPNTYKKYLTWCHYGSAATLLGGCLFNQEDNNHISCCMFAQDKWSGYNVCNTNYEAFRQCCREIRKFITLEELPQDYPINMPYKIGAGLGGGDWLIIYSILEEEFEGHNLILWKL